jgi:hypothetical protein
MNLAELWAQVPTMTDAELKQLTCCFPSEDTATLLFGQQEMGEQQFRIAVRNLSNGTFMLLADVLREMHPDVTDTNLYGPDFAPLMEQLGPTVDVIATDDAVAMLPIPPNTNAVGFDFDNPPAWVQPLGAHDAYGVSSRVSHEGFNYENLTDFNVWVPSPQSTLWRIYPDPGPLPWVQPTGASDAYAIGAQVSHTFPGRDVPFWESNIAANTTEPGGDGTFDRWWKPLQEVLPPGPQPWRQPVPGVWPAYRVGDQVTDRGSTWESTFAGNIWATNVFGWEVIQ